MTATNERIRMRTFICGIVFVIVAFGIFRSSQMVMIMNSPQASVSKSFQEVEDDISPSRSAQHVDVSNATQAPASVSKSGQEEEDKRNKTKVVHHVNVPHAVAEASNASQAKLVLRFDWTSLAPQSSMAQRMLAHQTNCSLPMGNLKFRKEMGIGSDLTLWGEALCNGMEYHRGLRSVAPWPWLDQEKCGDLASPMACYFPLAELNCEGDEALARQYPKFEHFKPLVKWNGYVDDKCPSIRNGISTTDFRTSATEYLFRHVAPRVVQEAERQLALVFGNVGHVPKDMITVHIRWGDKIGGEMGKVEMTEYINAIQTVLDRRSKTQRGQDSNEANIFLATEDPKAEEEFRKIAPPEWKIYLDQFYVEMLPHRVKGFNGVVKAARKLKGRAGLMTLGSLLVGMEANDFILTTASNWSRLYDELRRSIVNPRCNNCTTLIELNAVLNDGKTNVTKA